MATVKPRVRFSANKVAKGDIVEVKTLVNHVMESGQRKDSSGNVIPRKIINKFVCEVNGKVVFSCDLEPAVSANPFIQFKFKATETAEVKMTWTDDDGSTIEAVQTITVE